MTVLPRIVSFLGGSTGSTAPPSPQLNLTPVVLHFDINETIVLGDEAGSDTREDSIHKMLAKSAFVKIPEEQLNIIGDSLDDTSFVVPTHWWDGTSILENVEDKEVSAPAPLYTGWEWPPNCCPYYRTAYKKRAKRFVEHHGRMYKPLYDVVNEKLSFNGQHHEHALPAEVLSHMLPALFHTLQTLTNRGEPFRVVFRTFGTDLDEIAQAITLFAKGKHPDYPDFSSDRLILRQADLVKGRWEEHSDGTVAYTVWSRADEQIASGDEEVLQWLEHKSVCGIQDDYAFWSKNNCEPWAGKPVWAASRHRHHEHHILLDDNIHNLAHDSIASVRVQDESSGDFSSLSGDEIREMQGIHLIRVPTIEPVLNTDWFLRKIDEARVRYGASKMA